MTTEELTEYLTEVRTRGGETRIAGQYQTKALAATDECDGLVLLHCEGWRQYSRRFGARRASLSYLVGRDDAGTFAVRVAGTITTVAGAIAWLEPAKVRAARSRGLRVIRQGDVYMVERPTRLSDSLRGIPAGHTWDPVARTMRHGTHAAVQVPFRFSVLVQSALRMGRTNTRRRGD